MVKRDNWSSATYHCIMYVSLYLVPSYQNNVVSSSTSSKKEIWFYSYIRFILWNDNSQQKKKKTGKIRIIKTRKIRRKYFSLLEEKLVDININPPNKIRFEEAKRKVYQIWFGATSFESVSRSLIRRHKNWFGNMKLDSP